MIRLYKALIATGASIEIKPAKEFYGMLFIFHYKSHRHKYCMDMANPEIWLKETENNMIEELYRFVNYMNTLDGDFVSC